MNGHQPCTSKSFFRCGLTDFKCCWKCELGNCHYFYVFGTLTSHCMGTLYIYPDDLPNIANMDLRSKVFSSGGRHE